LQGKGKVNVIFAILQKACEQYHNHGFVILSVDIGS